MVVRVRPLNPNEIATHGDRKCAMVTGDLPKTVKVENKMYNYDHVALEDSTQEEIFEKVGKPVAASCLLGYNGCIFAYGQTGSGKTFTMAGEGL